MKRVTSSGSGTEFDNQSMTAAHPHPLFSRPPLLPFVLVFMLVLAGPQAQTAVEEEAQEAETLDPDKLVSTLGVAECAVLCLTDSSGVEQCSQEPVVCPDLDAEDAGANETLHERPERSDDAGVNETLRKQPEISGDGELNTQNETFPDKTAAATRNRARIGRVLGWMATAVLVIREC